MNHPAVFTLSGPTGPSVPVVLDSPHSGSDFPADFGAQVSEFDLRDGEDSFVDELYRPATELGVPLLAANFARTYIDANRHEGDVDLDLLQGAWPHAHVPSGKAAIGKALVWRTLSDGRDIYAARLNAAQVLHRIERYHRPYHQALRSLLDASVARHGQVFHINCHSMASTAGAMSGGPQGVARPDFVVGDRDGSSCDAAFTALVHAHLKAAVTTSPSTTPTRALSWCVPMPTRRRGATACSSKSTSASIWTSAPARSQPALPRCRPT